MKKSYGGKFQYPAEKQSNILLSIRAQTGDGQTTDEFSVSICAKTPRVLIIINCVSIWSHLPKQCRRLPRRYLSILRIGRFAAIRAGYDVVHGLIGPGIDASHAFERDTCLFIKAYSQSDFALYPIRVGIHREKKPALLSAVRAFTFVL